MIRLDDDTRDALSETFNLALGLAAEHFAELVGEEIELTVPDVALLPAADLVARVQAAPGLAGHHRLASVAQTFKAAQGALATEAVLLFSERGSLELLQRLLGGQAGPALGESEREALGEVGNVILNACMNRLAEVFARPMQGSLPRLRVGAPAALLAEATRGTGQVLWAGVGLRLAEQAVDGQVMFLMEPDALAEAIERVRAYFGMAEAA